MWVTLNHAFQEQRLLHGVQRQDFFITPKTVLKAGLNRHGVRAVLKLTATQRTINWLLNDERNWAIADEGQPSKEPMCPTTRSPMA